MKTIVLFSCILMAFFSCKEVIPPKPSQSIFLFRDKDGLYRYDPASGKEKIIYKAADWQIFLDVPSELSGDTLTFGMVGQLAASTEYDGEKYYNYFVSVDLKTGKSYVSREIRYTVNLAKTTLNIKTYAIDPGSHSTLISDTTMTYTGSAMSYRGVAYNENKPRFFSKHTLGNQSVFSLEGSIYHTLGTDTALLVKNQKFEPKFGNGYLQPQLDPSGKYVIFTYFPGLNGKSKASLQKLTLADKKTALIKTGKFTHPLFSADGKFILFRRNESSNKRDAWESDVYVLDLETLTETNIGKASLAKWESVQSFKVKP